MCTPHPDPDPGSLQCEYNQPSGLWPHWLSVSSSPPMLGDLGESPLPVVLVPSVVSQLPPPLAFGSPGSSRLGARTAHLQDIFVLRPSFLRPSAVLAAWIVWSTTLATVSCEAHRPFSAAVHLPPGFPSLPPPPQFPLRLPHPLLHPLGWDSRAKESPCSWAYVLAPFHPCRVPSGPCPPLSVLQFLDF